MVPGPELRPPSQDGAARVASPLPAGQDDALQHVCRPAGRHLQPLHMVPEVVLGGRQGLARPRGPLEGTGGPEPGKPALLVLLHEEGWATKRERRRAGPEEATASGPTARTPDTTLSPGKRTGARAHWAQLRGASRQREQLPHSQAARSRAFIGTAILCGPAQGTGRGPYPSGRGSWGGASVMDSDGPRAQGPAFPGRAVGAPASPQQRGTDPCRARPGRPRSPRARAAPAAAPLTLRAERGRECPAQWAPLPRSSRGKGGRSRLL